MITRVADHCFWLGRYIERTESTARQLQVTSSIVLDAELPSSRIWPPLVIVSGQEHDFVSRFGKDALGEGEAVQRYLVRDEENPVSLARSIVAARENARSIREVVSLEVWQTINELYVFFHSEEAARMFEDNRDAFYSRIRKATQLGLGLLRSTMLHDMPLDFIWLGVSLERISQTARLLDVEHHALSADSAEHAVLETGLWLSLLRACSGFEAFMKRNRGKVSGASVAAFLIKEAQFPRSVLYSTDYARQRLAAICLAAQGQAHVPGAAALRVLAELQSFIEGLSLESLSGGGVHAALTHVVEQVHEVCNSIAEELLNAGPRTQLQNQSQ